MAKAGRPKKPTALKVLEGNPGKRPLPENEPKPAPIVETPDPPAWMNIEGKEMWKRRLPELQRIGLVTTIDLESFAMLCQSWGEYVEAVKRMKNRGKYYTYTNKAGAENEIERPVVRVAHRAHERYKSMCTEFGLTAAARSRIEVKLNETTEDPMEALLSGVK